MAEDIQTAPELKRAIRESSEAEFDVLVRQTIEKMRRWQASVSCAPSHPMFGPMTAKDWLRWDICMRTIICDSLAGKL